MVRLLYTFLLILLLPYALFHLVWRARKQSEYLKHIPERFGYYSIKSDKPILWLHAVSVGETRAAEPLIKALMIAYPAYQILITHMTPTGRATSEQLFGNQVLRCYLAYDFEITMNRFLAHFKPAIGLIIETEIWPNLIHCCAKQSIPLLLLNARMSEKSRRNYSMFRSLTRESLKKFTAIAAQAKQDAQYLEQLGALKVSIMGNLKFDINPPPEQVEKGKHLKNLFGKRPIFVAASTREGEEALILDAVQNLAIPNLLTVIIPRHPQRFNEVAELLKKRGLVFQKRSEERSVTSSTSVLLGDSMGEMFAYYSACDVAFIGGSLVPTGGQNLIEACAVGKPVLIGPSNFNFAEAAKLAKACGAAKEVATIDELRQELSRLFNEASLREKMAEAAKTFSESHQGATANSMRLINEVMGRGTVK